MDLKNYSLREQNMVIVNSIERVINTTLQILDRCPQNNELVQINQPDWEELKPLVTKIWNDVRNDIFIARHKELTKK